MSNKKICPLSSFKPCRDTVLFQNYDVTAEDLKNVCETGAINLRNNDEPCVELLRGYCSEEACAWWLEDKQKCAIAVLGGKK